MNLNRLFFALTPDTAVQDSIRMTSKDLAGRMQPGGRLADPASSHLTLLFLGDLISLKVESDIRAAARKVWAPPFKMTIDQVSCFKKPIIWWLGSSLAIDSLDYLRNGILTAIKDVDVSPDRKRFVPHITILRDAQRTLPPKAIKPIYWEVTHFSLMRSLMRSTPPFYEEVERWALNPKAGAPVQQSLL